MNEMFGPANLSMFGIILFAAFFVFLFNYRHDNKDKYQTQGASPFFSCLPFLRLFFHFREL